MGKKNKRKRKRQANNQSNQSQKRQKVEDRVTSAEIERYLNVDVEPVKLPEIDEHHNKDTYPPLVLDGASGVGKTQQAFALLKGGTRQDPQGLVYIVLSKSLHDDEANIEFKQQIYKDMKVSTNMTSIFNKIGHVLEEMKQANSSIRDTFSMSRIEEKLWSSKEMSILIELLYKNVLHCKQKGEEEGFRLFRKSRTTQSTAEGKKEKLKGEVLFVDEALPSFASEEDKHRLKFLRNFGRVLKMRVVLAGTAATAAIMSTSPNLTRDDEMIDESRIQMSRFTWAEVQFLYKTSPTKFKIGEETWTIKCRPLVKEWRECNEIKDGDIQSIIKMISRKIGESKKFTNESRFIWSSGACLSTPKAVASPFLLKPSVLVQGHFFEPALLTYKQNGNERIYEGTGYQELYRKMGAQRITISRAPFNHDLVWIVKEESLDAISLSRRYGFVEYALSNCVQICLAREPLFAVALSFRNHFEMNNAQGADGKLREGIKNFKRGFRKAMPESSTQRTKGAVDGELHEHIIFAALQFACNPSNEPDIRTRRSVKDCVDSLMNYLKVENDIKEYNTIADCFMDHFGKILQRQNYPDFKWCPLDETLEAELEREMPWLVPACDKAILEETIKEYQTDNNGNSVANFFGDLNIAGLIPGTCNSRLDAHAYRWDSYKQNKGLTLDWAFEFRARGGNYSDKEAMKDLMRKCVFEEKIATANQIKKDAKKAFKAAVAAYEADKTNTELKKAKKKAEKALGKADEKKKQYKESPPQKPCHGMLIAVVNSEQSKCRYQTVTLNGTGYLRVVVLVGNALTSTV